MFVLKQNTRQLNFGWTHVTNCDCTLNVTSRRGFQPGTWKVFEKRSKLCHFRLTPDDSRSLSYQCPILSVSLSITLNFWVLSNPHIFVLVLQLFQHDILSTLWLFDKDVCTDMNMTGLWWKWWAVYIAVRVWDCSSVSLRSIHWPHKVCK